MWPVCIIHSVQATSTEETNSQTRCVTQTSSSSRRKTKSRAGANQAGGKTFESVYLHDLISFQRVGRINNKLQENHHLPAHCAARQPGGSAAARVDVRRPASDFLHGRKRGHLRPRWHSGQSQHFKAAIWLPCPQTTLRLRFRVPVMQGPLMSENKMSLVVIIGMKA